jgi:hypothetical protein
MIGRAMKIYIRPVYLRTPFYKILRGFCILDFLVHRKYTFDCSMRRTFDLGDSATQKKFGPKNGFFWDFFLLENRFFGQTFFGVLFTEVKCTFLKSV